MDQPEVIQANTGKAYFDAYEKGWADAGADTAAGNDSRYRWPENGHEYMTSAYAEGYMDGWNYFSE